MAPDRPSDSHSGRPAVSRAVALTVGTLLVLLVCCGGGAVYYLRPFSF